MNNMQYPKNMRNFCIRISGSWSFKHLAMLDQTINIQNKSKSLNKKRISK